jgi:anti-anti-sigma regulatory factor
VKKTRSRAKLKAAEPFKLGSRLTIAEVTELHRALLPLLAAGEPIHIDGTDVQEVDTAVLQLLVSLWRTAATQGIPVAWRGVSEVLRKSAAIIGIAGHIDLKDGAQLAHA